MRNFLGGCLIVLAIWVWLDDEVTVRDVTDWVAGQFETTEQVEGE